MGFARVWRKWLWLLLVSLPAAAQSIVNCAPGIFTAQTGGAIGTGPTTYCGVSPVGNQPSNWALAGNTYATPVTSNIVTLVPNTGGGGTHNVVSMTYQTAVNVQAFTASFQFTPNGQLITFFLNNNNNSQVDGGSTHLIGGASGEGGIYQGFCGTPFTYYGCPPNFTWWIVLHQDGQLTQGGSYTYSTVQMYGNYQAPFLPAVAENIATYPTNQLSTSPVNMNNPNTILAGSTDTFKATITYDGSTVTLNLFDVTAGGSCPGASCFTTTWSNVSIPSVVGGTTAYMGITDSTGACCSLPLTLLAASYTVNSPTGTIGGFAAYNASSTTNNGTVSANSPVFSEAGGTYGGAQSITMTVANSPNGYACYLKLAAGTAPTVLPSPDGAGQCASGTLYSGAVTCSTSCDLYATSGSNTILFSATLSPTGLGPPSPVTKATYIINASGAPASVWIISGSDALTSVTAVD